MPYAIPEGGGTSQMLLPTIAASSKDVQGETPACMLQQPHGARPCCRITSLSVVASSKGKGNVLQDNKGMLLPHAQYCQVSAQ